jgi:serine/threonine-protein phosphatase 2A regulatory subunit A
LRFYRVANVLQIAKAVDEEVVSRDLVPAFVKLLKDNEAEVRTAIAGQIPGFCALVDRATLLSDIMSSIEDLVSDTSQHVRAALGTQISGLAPILGKQETIDHLLPMFLQMLKDEFPEVRLHIISKLELVNQGLCQCNYSCTTLTNRFSHSHRHRSALPVPAPGHCPIG